MENVEEAFSLLFELHSDNNDEIEEISFLKDCCCLITSQKQLFLLFNRKKQSYNSETNQKIISTFIENSKMNLFETKHDKQNEYFTTNLLLSKIYKCQEDQQKQNDLNEIQCQNKSIFKSIIDEENEYVETVDLSEQSNSNVSMNKFQKLNILIKSDESTGKLHRTKLSINKIDSSNNSTENIIPSKHSKPTLTSEQLEQFYITMLYKQALQGNILSIRAIVLLFEQTKTQFITKEMYNYCLIHLAYQLDRNAIDSIAQQLIVSQNEIYKQFAYQLLYSNSSLQRNQSMLLLANQYNESKYQIKCVDLLNKLIKEYHYFPAMICLCEMFNEQMKEQKEILFDKMKSEKEVIKLASLSHHELSIQLENKRQTLIRQLLIEDLEEIQFELSTKYESFQNEFELLCDSIHIENNIENKIGKMKEMEYKTELLKKVNWYLEHSLQSNETDEINNLEDFVDSDEENEYISEKEKERIRMNEILDKEKNWSRETCHLFGIFVLLSLTFKDKQNPNFEYLQEMYSTLYSLNRTEFEDKVFIISLKLSAKLNDIVAIQTIQNDSSLRKRHEQYLSSFFVK